MTRQKNKIKKVQESVKKWCRGCFTLLMRQILIEMGMPAAPSGNVTLTGACMLASGCTPRGLPTAELKTTGRARELSHSWCQLQMREKAFRQLVSIWFLVTNPPALWPVISTACTSNGPHLVAVVMQPTPFQL